MITKSITNLNLLRIQDSKSDSIYYGCSQKWYSTLWQRKAGCGPSVASNIVHYLENKQTNSKQVFSRKSCSSLMEEAWKYFSPKVGGIHTTDMFCEAFVIFAKSRGMTVQYRIVDIPQDKCSRPKLAEVLYFLEEALEKDAPVAFLNLCNGAVKILERWHWVTIVSLDKSEDGKNAFVDILDGGVIMKIDLGLWYSTTTLGGGFVYFTAF